MDDHAVPLHREYVPALAGLLARDLHRASVRASQDGGGRNGEQEICYSSKEGTGGAKKHQGDKHIVDGSKHAPP